MTRQTRHALAACMQEVGQRESTKLFPNMHGGDLSADAVQPLLARQSQLRAAMSVGKRGLEAADQAASAIGC